MKTEVKSVAVGMKLENQKMEHIQALMKKIGGRGGCDACGRIARIAVEFGDPVDPGLLQDGVVNIQTIGL